MDFLKGLFAWFVARLLEPSTWAGTGLLAVSAVHVFPGSEGQAVAALVTAIGGVLAVVMHERKNGVSSDGDHK